MLYIFALLGAQIILCYRKIMYLKNLTTLGFKSFADKTSLNFLRGITAIVGPNGCGKSNVADAIRWVLGEQSAKALRGGEMSDVIFNGTDGRKPLGMAEVSLTIGDVDAEHLKAAGIELSYNELTVTRRVFRDGTSEYFLNKTPCRLKDIQQLFMGTGVGRSSYSIMAQGNITQIISSKPDDRRTVFEEAAGITRFKAQKKEALRKLESTEQNLLRVADLIREVKRQIGSLQRQAGKARRYKQLMLELQRLDTQLARHQFDVWRVEIRAHEMGLEEIRGELDHASQKVQAGENEISGLRQALSELEQEIHRSQQRALELTGEIDRHQGRRQFNQERLEELAAQNSRAFQEIAVSEERQRAAVAELAVVNERWAASARLVEEKRHSVETRQAKLRGLEATMTGWQDELREKQSDAFAAGQSLTRARNEIAALDLQKQANLARMEKLSSEKIQLEEERSGLKRRLGEFAREMESQQQTIESSQEQMEERENRAREVQSALERLSGELEVFLRQQAETRSRLGLLEQLQKSYEGFSPATATILQRSQIGSLADKVRVPDRYIAAVEAVLGHGLQLLLAPDPEGAEEILAELAGNRNGRAGIAALSLVGRAASAAAAELPPNIDPSAVAALSVVEADPTVEPLLRALLGRAFIVPDLATARRLWDEAPGRRDFVTLSGEMLARDGIYSGGGAGREATANVSILARKNQIIEAEASLVAVQESINEASRRKGMLLSEQTALRAQLEEAGTSLRLQQVSAARHQGELKALEASGRMLEQKIETVVYEIQSLASAELEWARRKEELEAEVGALQSAESEALGEVEAWNEKLESARLEREEWSAGLTEEKVAFAAEQQFCLSLRSQKAPLEQRLEELGQVIEQRQSEITAALARKTQAEQEISRALEKVAALEIDRAAVNENGESLLARRALQEAEIESREEFLRLHRQRFSELQEARGAIDISLAQKNMAVQNLRERIEQKYQVKLDDIRSECITITYADEGRAKVEVLTPEEMAACGVSTDWEAVAGEVAALQKRIDEMGPINLVAIEEYEETEQRHAFLSGQYDDLIQAKQQLLDVINRVNTQTKEMFRETFQKIRDNFRAIFTEIFGGGKADLLLVDEGDVLESGIDIVARPPGKQLQSISLLSGGEQTMTAVALLFAIYEVKPSPFCVLDELDAPLDESNINRFIRILQRFLAQSQFIIITHNKRTIGMADVLYGITMQEQGISKIVSVKFHKANETVTDHAPEPLVPPAPVPDLGDEEDKPHRTEETLELAETR